VTRGGGRGGCFAGAKTDGPVVGAVEGGGAQEAPDERQGPPRRGARHWLVTASRRKRSSADLFDQSL
jgi:hypothetical protein